MQSDLVKMTLFKGFLQYFLFVMVFIMNVSFRERGLGDDSVDWQVALRLCFIVGAFGISMLCIKSLAVNILRPDNIAFIPLFLLISVSVIGAPSLTYSAGCALSILSIFFYIFVSCTVLKEDRVLKTIIYVSTFISLISLFVYFAFPEMGKEKAWFGDERIITNRLGGVTGANGAGFISASAILLIVVLKKYFDDSKNKIIPLLFLINLATLLLSESRTSIFALGVALIYIFFSSPSKTKIIAMSFSIAILIIMVFVIDYDALLVSLSRSGNASEITTGTGRVYIWQACSELISQKIFLGWGYGSSSFILPSYSESIGHTPPHCHNVLLQLAFSAGIFAAFLFLIAFIIKAISSYLKNERVCIAMLIFILLSGLTEASAFIGLANMATIMYALTFAMKGKKND
jgi:exopolysaccharide production protein ExoQ